MIAWPLWRVFLLLLFGARDLLRGVSVIKFQSSKSGDFLSYQWDLSGQNLLPITSKTCSIGSSSVMSLCSWMKAFSPVEAVLIVRALSVLCVVKKPVCRKQDKLGGLHLQDMSLCQFMASQSVMCSYICKFSGTRGHKLWGWKRTGVLSFDGC